MERALKDLLEGNERFIRGLRCTQALGSHLRLEELVKHGQNPKAIVLTCSDSRVPAELVFDQGLGDLFVIRVAGNVVQPTQIASIEFAASVLGTKLCLVMGHTGCGAVRSAFDHVVESQPAPTPNIGTLLNLIVPAVRDVLKETPRDDAQVLEKCVAANVRRVAAELKDKSSLLRELTQAHRFKTVEAVFDMTTGRVVLLS